MTKKDQRRIQRKYRRQSLKRERNLFRAVANNARAEGNPQWAEVADYFAAIRTRQHVNS